MTTLRAAVDPAFAAAIAELLPDLRRRARFLERNAGSAEARQRLLRAGVSFCPLRVSRGRAPCALPRCRVAALPRCRVAALAASGRAEPEPLQHRDRRRPVEDEHRVDRAAEREAVGPEGEPVALELHVVHGARDAVGALAEREGEVDGAALRRDGVEDARGAVPVALLSVVRIVRPFTNSTEVNQRCYRVCCDRKSPPTSARNS